MNPTLPREKLLKRWGALTQEYQSWQPHYALISDSLLPRSGRFFVGMQNRGERRHNKIYDSTGTRALRVLAAGMMSGMTSPARPWFRLSVSDPELTKYQPVKIWLHDVTVLMLEVFQRSNTYRSLHTMYEELGAFGTASSIILPDYDDVIRHYTGTIGEYRIATDYRGQVNTLYREYQKTVAELVGEFGLENCSHAVKNMHSSGALDKWITCIHAIEPRTDRDTTKKDAKNMAYKSVHFELAGEEGKFLRESGFKGFPAVVPRWAVAGGDIYGNSPGMEALGDIQQLQHEQLRKSEGIDYKTNPPLQVPSTMSAREMDRLPGGISFVNMAGPANQIKTLFDVNLDMSHLLEDIRDVRERIKSTFYADLFLMISQADTKMTATEVAERHEEKLLMLGPVLERLHNELLNPMIEMTFTRMIAAGIVPKPPVELHGMNLNIEYVSMLAQAQKAIGTNSVDRFVNSLGGIATIKPEVLDKFDADQWVDVYSDMLGINPNLIVPGDKVAIIRKARAEAAQAQAMNDTMQQRADTVKSLATSPTDGNNALADVTRQFSGYT